MRSNRACAERATISSPAAGRGWRRTVRSGAVVAGLIALITTATVGGPISSAQAGTGSGYALAKVKLASGRSVVARWNPCQPAVTYRVNLRSEEHTSELQSHVNLVCRLLLEKKNVKGERGTR